MTQFEPLPLHRFRGAWQVGDTPVTVTKAPGRGRAQWIARGDLLIPQAAVPWLIRHELMGNARFSRRAELVRLISELDRDDPLPRMPRRRLIPEGDGRYRAGTWHVSRDGDRWAIKNNAGRRHGTSETLFQASCSIAALDAFTRRHGDAANTVTA